MQHLFPPRASVAHCTCGLSGAICVQRTCAPHVLLWLCCTPQAPAAQPRWQLLTQPRRAQQVLLGHANSTHTLACAHPLACAHEALPATQVGAHTRCCASPTRPRHPRVLACAHAALPATQVGAHTRCRIEPRASGDPCWPPHPSAAPAPR